MPSQRALAAIVVLVGVVAIGAAAAGVDQPDQRTGSGEGVGEGPGEGPGQSGDGEGMGAEAGEPIGFPAWVIEWYFIIGVGVVTVVGVVAIAVLIRWYGLDGALSALATVRDTVLGVLLLGLLFAVLLWYGLDWSTYGEQEPPPQMDPGGGGSVETQPETGMGIPPIVIVVAAVLVVGVAVVLLRRRGDDDDGEPATGREELEAEEPTVADLGGADPEFDVADETPDNPVYRAWSELARRAGTAHERTRTPGEVADAAIDEGLPREAVRTITNEFSAVRYGHRPVTDERERRAESALRTIEGTGGEA